MIAHLSEQPDSTAQTKIYIFILSHSVACLPAFLLNAALAMSLRRRLPTDTHMRAFCVIKVYNALQDDAALINGGNGHLVQPFTFDDTVGTLCNGILKRISTFSHTDADSSVLEFSDVSNDELRSLLDIKVYVEADADERILRRVIRDVKERGRDVEGIAKQYLTTVKPMHYLYVEPTRALADIVINSGLNDVAFDLIRSKITLLLQQ